MAEVKWTARRVSDGVLVDVTGDTEGTPVIAPTANVLEANAITPLHTGVATSTSIMLSRSTTLDIKAATTRAVVWDKVLDNLYDQVEITGGTFASRIPTGLGLTVNGTTGEITTAVAGVWAYEFGVWSIPVDATCKFLLALNIGIGLSAPVLRTAAAEASAYELSGVIGFSAGVVLTFNISTLIAGTGASVLVEPNIVLVRLQ